MKRYSRTDALSLALLAQRGPKSVLELLQLIASHNSYHLGQIALLRRSFDAVLSLRVVYEGVRWMDEIEDLDPGSAHARRLWADALSGLRAEAGEEHEGIQSNVRAQGRESQERAARIRSGASAHRRPEEEGLHRRHEAGAERGGVR